MDRWLSCRVSGVQYGVACRISCSGDYDMLYWWDLIKSKHLSSVSVFCSILHSPFSLKSSFSVKDFSLLSIRWTKRFWLGFSVKQIIDSLSFLFVLIHIELNSNSEKCLNNIANHENLDLSRFFRKCDNQTEKNVLRIIPYFAPASCNAKAIFVEELERYFFLRDKLIYAFPLGIIPKVSVILGLEFKLGYSESSTLPIRPQGLSDIIAFSQMH